MTGITRTRTAVAVALSALLLASCAAEDGRSSDTPSSAAASAVPDDDVTALTAGDVTALLYEFDGSAFDALISGELAVNAKGCLSIGDVVAVFPSDSAVSEDGTSITVPGYDAVSVGEDVSVSGGSEEVPRDEADTDLLSCIDDDADEAAYVVVAPMTD